jgi:isopentenyl diphosphate isomerase/L-lactate dehydrogenase-like FMN-dependent dehydrogenase
MQSKSPEDVLHEAVLMVLDQNAEIKSLEPVLAFKNYSRYVLRDSQANRNLIKISTDGLNHIVFTELTPNNVHGQWQNFYAFKIQRHMLYSPEERHQIETLAGLIKKFCEERMYNAQLFVTNPRLQHNDDDVDFNY